MTRKRIEEGWLAFARIAVPATASDMQRSMMRMAFYAGASCFYHIATNLSEGGALTPEDEEVIDGTADEIRSFHDEIRAKATAARAGRN